MVDLFNNGSNDYIYPDVGPCAGNSDSYIFEFLPKELAGVVSGNSEISTMDFSDLKQPVTGWNQQTRLLQPGEVMFVQGLTKGISTKTQYYPIDGSVSFYNYNDPMYMSADISINYYLGFKYYENDIRVTADEVAGINIADAMNIAFGAKGIGVYANWDPSKFTFSGTQAGYEFDVTALDVSLWNPDVSTAGNALYEDVTSQIPSSKYPNSAMLGYVLKVTYPTTSYPQSYSDGVLVSGQTYIDDSQKYVKLNHAPTYLTFYEPSSGNENSYVQYYKKVDVGMNGGSTSDTMSAADYLSYVDSNGYWEKVGSLKMWIAAEDPANSNIDNLITGFYIFNPQTFAVQVTYMIII